MEELGETGKGGMKKRIEVEGVTEIKASEWKVKKVRGEEKRQ